MKTSKQIVFLIGIVFLISCCNSTSKSPERNIDRVKIKYVDFFSIMTFLPIDCANFEKEFKNSYNEFEIEDKSAINELLSILNSLDTISNAYINTRGKIEIYSKEDTLLYCVGDLTLSFQEVSYKTPQSLIDFIEKYDNPRATYK